MTKSQITRILSDIDDTSYAFDTWFQPKIFSYIVLKDNSLLYIGDRDMWYLDDTDELLYVASAPYSIINKKLEMPAESQSNIDRITTVIDFQNINHVAFHYRGEHLGGRR
jgi:hypothetical protein